MNRDQVHAASIILQDAARLAAMAVGHREGWEDGKQSFWADSMITELRRAAKALGMNLVDDEGKQP